MKRIKNCLGLIIDSNGIIHEFGNIKKKATCHDDAFRDDILTSNWFTKFIKDNNYNYLNNMSIHYQAENLAALGLVVVINGSFIDKTKELNIYCYFLPPTLSEEQKITFRDNYEEFNHFLQENNAKIEAMACLGNGIPSWNDIVYDFTDVCDRLNVFERNNSK